MHLLRKYFIAGLLVWLPLAATVFVIKLLIDLLDKAILLFPLEWQPETIFGFSIPGFGIVIGVSILILTGAFATNFFGKKLVGFWEAILGQIPVVRTIYSSIKQVLETLFKSNNDSFRRVVLIEYPRKGAWSLGFQTNEALAAAKQASNKNLVSIFVPTTPNPTSGFIIMLPSEDITQLDISVENGFKFIISMGVIVPEGPNTDFSTKAD